MSRSVLVINPWVSDFKLYDEWMHPLGLYFLISLLRRNGVDVGFFNCLQQRPSSKPKRHSTGDFEQREIPKPAVYHSVKRTYKLYGQPEEAFSSFLSSVARPDAIFLGSGMTYWLPGLVETARFVKNAFPRTPIVIGGISARLIPDHVRAAVPGAYVFEGSVFDQAALNASGAPMLSGLRCEGWKPTLLDAYASMTGMRHGPALSSLGCPGACSYCASAVLQGRYAVRESRTVADEIEYLHERFKVENFAFFDDALLHMPEKNFIPLITTIMGRGLNVRFHTPNGLQVQRLSPEIGVLMKRAGFSTLRFGYESGEARFARDTGAKTSRGQLAARLSMLKETGFSGKDIGVYVMAGLPGQSPADVVREIQFVASLSVMVKPVFLSPVPRTELFESYRAVFPGLAADPLRHNDSFFVAQLPGWDAQAVQHVVDTAKKNNASLDTAHR